MANIKSMNLQEALAYQKKLESQGKTISTSKEMGKLSDYIKTLQPQKYGQKELGEAYRKLSSGVTERGGWTEANIGNIQQYAGFTPQLEGMGKEQQVTPRDQALSTLGDFQQSTFQAAGTPQLRDQIAAQLEPQGLEKPQPTARVEQYEQMREQMGVTQLESSLNTLKTELEQQIATRRARTQTAEGAPVAMGVIAGRVSEIERQEAERIDAITRQINSVNDQLNTSYNTISTYMNFMNMDYQDAVAAYDRDYQRNLQIYQLTNEQLDRNQANARANLQIYQNGILSGAINYDNLPSSQKTAITKLELQSGLPIGITSAIKNENAGGKVLSSTSREVDNKKYIDILLQMPDGSFRVDSKFVGSTGTTVASGGSNVSKFIEALGGGNKAGNISDLWSTSPSTSTSTGANAAGIRGLW